MKRINYNKLLVLSGVFILGGLGSCIKDYRSNETNLSSLQATANIVEGGMYQFSSQALLFPASDLADTTYFHINYAATNVAPADETFSIAIDPAALTAYNGLGGLQYQPLPDSCFTFTTTSVVVAKGQTYSAGIPVIVYPSKIDPTINYMLPITLKQAPQGVAISSNVSTVYYHFIGNPIAGTYEQYWTRWNHIDTTVAPAYNKVDVGPVIFSPNNPTEIQVGSQGTGETDIIDFTNNNGVLSNFSVTFPGGPTGQAAALGLQSMSAPVLETADPVHGIYRIYFTYVNGAGSPRCIINNYVKQ